MVEQEFDRVIKSGRVIDPAQGIDQIGDVGIKDGKIAGIGKDLRQNGAEVTNATGLIVTPGLIDIHVHAYGILGFAYPDRIGVYQGVTSMVEAGGPGVGTFEEFSALMTGSMVTSLYAGAYIRPLGIIGVDYVEGDVRSMKNIPIDKWLDLAAENKEVFRYLKIGAFGNYGTGMIKIGKGLAEILQVPLYVHTGDFSDTPQQVTTPTAYRVADQGDIITHLYHSNPGNILTEDGKVIQDVKDAARRGVLFDIGFGGFNFSFTIAEKALAQNVVPNIISSDLQQVNVTGPAYSLSNVMSIFLTLGFSLPEVIERVTINPARALSLDNKAGSLRSGLPADLTVLQIEDGDFSFADCAGNKLSGRQRIKPVMTFKGGIRYDVDLEWAQEQKNWLMQICEDKIPAAASSLDSRQKDFLERLALALENLDWSPTPIDLRIAENISDRFHHARDAVGIPLREALLAVYRCFLEEPFTYQIGLFLFRLQKPFAIERMRAVAGAQMTMAGGKSSKQIATGPPPSS
jgi:dihydroorotase